MRKSGDWLISDAYQRKGAPRVPAKLLQGTWLVPFQRSHLYDNNEVMNPFLFPVV
jgi:hypothetical protein